MSSGMYAAQRSLVAPAMVVVGFPANGSATIIDAIDQLVTNQHKRGPLQWEPAARALDSRNSAIRSLRRRGKIGTAKAMLLGPRFAEAIQLYGMHVDSDFRIGEVARIFHGQDARRPLREAFGTPHSKPGDRCEVIAAVIGEQVRDADPAFRSQIDTTLRDILSHPPFFGTDVPELTPQTFDVDELVETVKRFEEMEPRKLSPGHVHLGVKGGIALVLLGALAREHGALASEVARPYTVVQRMIHDPFGQELLGEAIKALRFGAGQLPARDPQTREPKGRDAENRIVPMTPANCRELFVLDGSGERAGDSRGVDEILAEVTTIARNKIGLLLAELNRIPEVAKQGIAPHKVRDLVDLLMDQAGDLDYLGRKGADHLRTSEDRPSDQAEQTDPIEVSA
ncbi:MAG: hypothetical protein ABSG43_18050 [Solirubrobacteraceae bacterium]